MYIRGQVYIGSFKNDKINGEGNVTMANGDNYVGDFKDEKKDGEGVFSWYREPYRYSELILKKAFKKV